MDGGETVIITRKGDKNVVMISLEDYNSMIKALNNVQYLGEQLQDPVFKEKYDALEPEFVVMQAMIDARKNRGMTQEELAKATGISQADISRLEKGTGNPSIKTLQRVARALKMSLKIEFVPYQETKTGKL